MLFVFEGEVVVVAPGFKFVFNSVVPMYVFVSWSWAVTVAL